MDLRALRHYLQTHSIEQGFLVYAISCGITLLPWQFQECIRVIKNPATLWRWGRGMSKTFLCALLATYFAIRFLKVCYLVPSAKQFDQALEYFESNPYIDKRGRDRKIAPKNWYYVGGKKLIHIDLVSINSVNSGRFNVVIYDEMAQLVYLPKKEALVPKSYGMLKAMYPTRRFYTSTPLIGSLFQKQEFDLQKQAKEDGKPLDAYVSFRNFENTENPYLDIKAIIKEKDELDRLGLFWLWEQENLAKWVVPGGTVFTNIYFEESTRWNGGTGYETTHVGVDFHGAFGQVVVEFFYDPSLPQEIYVTGESRHPQQDNSKIDLSWLSTYAPGIRKAVEGGVGREGQGGFNDGYARLARGYGCSVIPSDAATRSRTLLKALGMSIHIDESITPNLADDIRKAVWDSNKIYLLKDSAHPNHYLDAFLVGIGGIGSGDVYNVSSDTSEYQGDYITALKLLQRKNR